MAVRKGWGHLFKTVRWFESNSESGKREALAIEGETLLTGDLAGSLAGSLACLGCA